MTPPRVLVIAGSDSGGGAGIQADIKAITMLGGHAMTAVTAVTAQNSLGVTAVHAIPPALVAAQIDAVASDLGLDAVKIGMLGGAAIVAAVADRLAALPPVPVVFDPVMIATSGAVLADAATVAAFARLMARAALVTPNLPELAALTGMGVAGETAVEAAAATLARLHGVAVLAKGGHGEGPVLTDRLFDAAGAEVARWHSDRIDTRHTHGTGCTLASGIAVGLATGLGLADAIGRARAYVRAAILAAPGYGAGAGPMGHALGRDPFAVLAA